MDGYRLEGFSGKMTEAGWYMGIKLQQASFGDP